jgi:thiamine biosynthesis lipoprotein
MKAKDRTFKANGAFDRRSFLKLSGLLGLGCVAPGIVPASAEAIRFNRKAYKVSTTRLAMGTFVSMTLIHPSKDRAEEAIDKAFEEIRMLSRSLSRFDTAAAVAQLNRDGFLDDLPSEVTRVVARAMDYYRLTQQRFDITVKPVEDLFKERFADDRATLPSEEELEKAIMLVGSKNISLKGRSIRFKQPGMGITLDGIAKGYVVDRASEIIASHQIKNYLINAGGDIRTKGSRSKEKAWTVAIQDPQKKQDYPDVIHLSDAAVATSGNYEVYFDREKMFHHIVDPKTGLSPELSTSVSVIAPTAMDADALSTSLFVMSPTEARHFVGSISGCECFVIAKTGKIFRSPGWRSAAT